MTRSPRPFRSITAAAMFVMAVPAYAYAQTGYDPRNQAERAWCQAYHAQCMSMCSGQANCVSRRMARDVPTTGKRGYPDKC
jgi:hypothetical protein